ncbi:hypothetical protein [Bacteroides pyogenes]|uniref:hypothetical protein n=1 Tax=Bacteroides pyogenes TaxID=310300 RepID=UPI001BADEC9F|nr:hypothetical protein [Bacteroides pyogenes]MBR8726328.1 hypothetical protein [Bacteroides pyogenes]MBR8739702.1 hypothetical protein [Bacteroides pyogenes]MBR8755501.1 hypothetical protein [Bacteroides pyogenes]MBR8796778.1 hypothetical protein [Bacteroides pyogenes]MBR8810382.1 hypothetical protein [Bacteroides pyogenes]
MSIYKKIFQLEFSSSESVRLRKKVSFCKTYDYSACLFAHELRACLAKRKYGEDAVREANSISFSMAELSVTLLEELINDTGTEQEFFM